MRRPLRKKKKRQTRTHTTKRLVLSLARQRKIDVLDFEVICLVNNDLLGSRNYTKIYESNQKILRMDMLANPPKGVNITVIDRSSLGREIAACNILAFR